MYWSWSGRYTALVACSLLNPISFGQLGTAYKLACLLQLVLLFGALVALLRALLRGAAGTFRQLLQAGAGAFLLLVYHLPSTAECFYWLTAGYTYVLAVVLLLLALAVLAASFGAQRAGRRLGIGAVAGLLFLAVGCNETVAVPVLLLAWAAVAVLRGQARRNGLALALVVSLGCALAFAAPGNVARMHGEPFGKPGIWFCLTHTALFVAYCLVTWLGNGVLVAVTMLLVPALARLARFPDLPLHRFAQRPVLLTLLVPAFLAAGLFPSFWVRSAAPPLRALSLLHICFVLTWLLAAHAWVLYAARRREQPLLLALPGFVRGGLLVWLLCTFFTDYNHHLRDAGHRFSTNNSFLAYRDLLHGTAARYDAQLTARYAYLRGRAPLHAQVPALEATPIILLYGDIGPDSANWGNQAYAGFFHKKTIVARPAAAEH
ncbi:hypothetical protein I2H31_18780 [Hymenobacter sp. BT662]|uniref:Glycosyltransferase RgtA/B/C/D-like domain-containing protein n=2 Tax=Hymenobacter ruricola TaxID=2791023 RepID=A0ABS0I864_9BACT|nr:DUF6056 family protein [Hymenobacter ruricola]MBF9223156.1 hypothetical protein [Hymenobacter ruricola]